MENCGVFDTTNMTDLDELERLYAAATKEQWILRPMSYGYDLAVPSQVSPVPGSYGGWFAELHTANFGQDEQEAKDEFEANALLIIAFHNAFPALAAELRALRELVGECRGFAENMRQIFAAPNFTDRYDDAGRCERMIKRIDALQSVERARMNKEAST